MRDLSRFDDDAFDFVWQPYSINFVPDYAPVFQGVARVLRPGMVHAPALAAIVGDWIAQCGTDGFDAVEIDIDWYEGSGTTTGYTDDYDVACPMPSTSPDVVYVLTPATDMLLTFDLYGSDYDTRIWIWEEEEGQLGLRALAAAAA